ncbi:MAG: sortase [Clostridia bacterium]|nr:sortase [Clostridia bacterium]
MIRYTTRYVNIVSLVITIIIYIFLSYFITNLKIFDFNLSFISNLLKKNIVQVELNSSNINQETKEDFKIQNNYPNDTKENEWKITIPILSLEAEISEGTNKEVMDKYVGHFVETSKTEGNICLAAHNRGYKVNYFNGIKKLKEGDEIVYKYKNFEKTYLVIKNKIIKDTEWSDLEKTEKNQITLITCVENEPEYRRCIKAIEKEEE